MPMKRSALPKLKSGDIHAALGGADPRPAKLDRINFLVAVAEKQEIQETAKGFGLTVTEYLLRLHRLTRSMLQSRRTRPRRTAGARSGS
jgi:hypothetical protein